jgi:hypothetical protein
MRGLMRGATVVAAITALSGCATIVGGGTSQPVSLQSAPGAATYAIRSSSGISMAQGTTPATVSLPRKNEYQVEVSLAGYQPQSTVLTRGINGWIWGNLVVGWILGFGIDFLTGSAYKLEPAQVQVTLQQVEDAMFAVIRLLDDRSRLIGERRLLMVPVD